MKRISNYTIFFVTIIIIVIIIITKTTISLNNDHEERLMYALNSKIEYAFKRCRLENRCSNDITLGMLYENGYLTIKATKTVNLKVEAYIRRERFYGEVKRSFYIGEKKESDIKANYESGILTITFPKEDILKNEKQNIIIK